MNIEQYREMVANEAKQAEQETQQTESQGSEQTNVEQQPTETQENATPVQQTETIETPEGAKPGEVHQEEPIQTTPTVPEVIEIDGKPVPIDELKNGYLRQSDYTKKTQELARQREQQAIADAYYQAINSRPELAEAVAKQFNLPFIDPTQAELMEAKHKLQDMELKQEVDLLSSKYSDFEAREVLNFAVENKIENLEHAYTLLSHQKGASVKADPIVEAQEIVDVASLKEEIRQELLKELQSNVDTQSLIQTSGSAVAVKDTTPTLSQTELKVARNLRMTPEEYAKWRDNK